MNSSSNQLGTVLADYFNSLTNSDFVFISNNIINKFTSYKNKLNSHQAKKIYSFYSKNQSQNLRHSFESWKEGNIKGIFKRKHMNRTVEEKFNLPCQLYNKDFLSSPPSIRNFLIRLEKYQYRTNLAKERLTIDKDETVNLQCTFSPKISLIRSNSSSTGITQSAYTRLYNDSNRRLKKKKDSLNSSNAENKRKIDKKTIEKLYNDYKRQLDKKTELQKKFDEEDGMSFSPTLRSPPKYLAHINGGVLLHSQKTLQDKKDFMKSFSYLQDIERKKGKEVLKNKKDIFDFCFSNEVKN